MSSPVKHEEKQHCALSGVAMLPSEMLCFVLDPAGNVVFDVKQSLPVKQRLWLAPKRAVVEQAMAQGVFSQLDAAAHWQDDLPQQVEMQLLRRLQEGLSLMRRSGALIGGFEKVKSTMMQGKAAALVQASDASEDGRLKLAKLAGHYRVPVIAVLKREVLSSVTGQENQAHIALSYGGLASRFIEESQRFAEYTADKSSSEEG